jgi:hypothetical protein
MRSLYAKYIDAHTPPSKVTPDTDLQDSVATAFAAGED